MMTVEQRAKAQVTRAKNKADADAKLKANIGVVTTAVREVIMKCTGKHFMERGSGVSCFVWFTADVSDGRKVRRVKDCYYATSLVYDDNFHALMKEIPGVVNHHINLD